MTPTPKEKAQELIEMFNIVGCPVSNIYTMSFYQRKQCAIKCVEEILKAEPTEPNEDNIFRGEKGLAFEYWNKVLAELKNTVK